MKIILVMPIWKKMKKLTADSVYRQYSATKVLVCTGAMMLYERGKFLLNDPIYEYFPEWKHTMVAETQEDGQFAFGRRNGRSRCGTAFPWQWESAMAAGIYASDDGEEPCTAGGSNRGLYTER